MRVADVQKRQREEQGGDAGGQTVEQSSSDLIDDRDGHGAGDGTHRPRDHEQRRPLNAPQGQKMREGVEPPHRAPEEVVRVVEQRERVHEERRIVPETRVQIAREEGLGDVGHHQFVRPGPHVRHAEAKSVEANHGGQREQQPQLWRPTQTR
jgi:hypothetical protein